MTYDTQALVARLRAPEHQPPCIQCRGDRARAADTIEALEAEVEDLKKWWGRSVRATEKREQERDAYAALIALALADSWPVKHDQAHINSLLIILGLWFVNDVV